MCHISEHIAIPAIRWLGVFPSEIPAYDIDKKPLTPRDHNKIESLLSRPFIEFHPKIKEQLETMQRNRTKSEIEGLVKCKDILSNFYLPLKLLGREYI